MSSGAASLNSPSGWARFRSAPIIVQAYTVFAIVSVALAMSVFVASPFYQIIYPYVGGGLILYGFTLSFAFSVLLLPQRSVVYGIVLILGLMVGFGVFNFVDHIFAAENVRRGFDNPMLTYSPYRPLFSITIPLGWLMLHVSPGVRRWVHSAPEGGAAPGRHQFRLIDLLYTMLTVSVCLAMSLTLVGAVKRCDPWVAGRAAAAPTTSSAPGQVTPTK